jgi:hypothetical protein
MANHFYAQERQKQIKYAFDNLRLYVDPTF